MIKKIAILTSGGDAPGMNTAVKAIVNAAINKGLDPYLVYEGYKGLTEGNFKKVTKDDVRWIGNQGGTNIYSARYPEFKDVEVRKIAVEKMNKEGIDALVAIGGDGSYMGAAKLTEMGIRTIGLPGTIDNDISSTDYTIGYHTALDTIVRYLDQVRETGESHNRLQIVEVMGRYCGDLAINAALAVGADILSASERKLSEEDIIKQVKDHRASGKRSILMVTTEHIYEDLEAMGKRIEEATGVETRTNVIAQAQRGGKPTADDRVLATNMGVFAVEKLIEGETGVAVNIVNNEYSTKDILEVVKMERPSKKTLIDRYELSK